jgi:hypothetical protein
MGLVCPVVKNRLFQAKPPYNLIGVKDNSWQNNRTFLLKMMKNVQSPMIEHFFGGLGRVMNNAG